MRSTLRPPLTNESLNRAGTRVSVRLRDKSKLLVVRKSYLSIHSRIGQENTPYSLFQLVSALAPTLEIDVWTREGARPKEKTISAGDWRDIDQELLLKRLEPISSPFFGRERFLNHLHSMATRITSITDSDGVILGRCSIEPKTFVGSGGGAITVGGLFGGEISNLVGILAGEQLDLLDRSAAVPIAPASALENWANEQSILLQQQGILTLDSSEILLNLCASNEDLFIISHGFTPLTTKEFRELISHIDEIWILNERRISYEPDIDDVLKHEFESQLQLDSKVFLINSNISGNPFIGGSHWPEQLFPATLRSSAKIAEKILNETWGNGEQEESFEIIGTVSEIPISGTVTIFHRKS